MDNAERQVMILISKAGEGRSKALESIAMAKNGDFEKAKVLLDEANEAVLEGHKQTTEWLWKEAEGNGVHLSFLMAHALDHIMNAITLIDTATEMVELYEMVYELKTTK